MKEVKVCYSTHLDEDTQERCTKKITTDTSRTVGQIYINVTKVTINTPPKFIFKNKKPKLINYPSDYSDYSVGIDWSLTYSVTLINKGEKEMGYFEADTTKLNSDLISGSIIMRNG